MASPPPGILVVGAGQAAVSLVTRLRELGDDSPVTVVGDEAHPPYERPPLSKAHLHPASGPPVPLPLLTPERWRELDVHLLTGTTVTDLTRGAGGAGGAGGGGVATTTAGPLPFERLALVTGAEARRLDVPGSDLPGVVTLRSVEDADALAARLRPGATHLDDTDGPGGPRGLDVVVVGGGFIGLEVAATARDLGHRVTVVEVTDRLLGRAVTPQLSGFFALAHDRRGVRVLLGRRVVSLESAGPTSGRPSSVGTVVLDDGERLTADVVVTGVGARPRTALATALGLEVAAGGVVVDEHAVASDGSTVAAGDCALGPNPFSRGLGGPLRLESVAHAVDQARVAAATLAGRPEAYRAVPWFWSDQFDLHLQISGLPHGADRVVVRGDPATEAFSLLAFRDGLLVAAECVGRPADHVAVKRGLEKGLTADPDAVADADVPLRRLLRPA
jgi:NADPH-dependent 2,4-dienoyl-CoA reductase/sulfur reductase-like enzyme